MDLRVPRSRVPRCGLVGGERDRYAAAAQARVRSREEPDDLEPVAPAGERLFAPVDALEEVADLEAQRLLRRQRNDVHRCARHHRTLAGLPDSDVVEGERAATHVVGEDAPCAART